METKDKIIQLINNCLNGISVNDTAEALIHLLDDEYIPIYTKKGDYCAVCGCNEFWNDEWMDEEE